MTTKFLFLTALIGVLPLTMAAQDDDLYFTPKKRTTKNVATGYNSQPYYCGSNRDIDEYNRRGKLKSYYQKIGTDSLGNDIIEFHAGDDTYGNVVADSTITIYPGSERYYDDDDADFVYSRRMGRFDGFYWSPSYYGYWSSPYWRSYYGWYDPWYSSYYYGGWYDPWLYGYYGWGHPYYGWAGGWYAPYWSYSYNGPTGTLNHSTGRGHFYGNRNSFANSSQRSSFNSATNGYRGNNTGFGKRRSSFSDNPSYNTQPSQTQRPTQRPSYNNQNSFGTNRGSFGGGSHGSFGGGSHGSFGGGGGSRGGGFGGRR